MRIQQGSSKLKYLKKVLYLFSDFIKYLFAFLWTWLILFFLTSIFFFVLGFIKKIIILPQIVYALITNVGITRSIPIIYDFIYITKIHICQGYSVFYQFLIYNLLNICVNFSHFMKHQRNIFFCQFHVNQCEFSDFFTVITLYAF